MYVKTRCSSKVVDKKHSVSPCLFLKLIFCCYDLELYFVILATRWIRSLKTLFNFLFTTAITFLLTFVGKVENSSCNSVQVTLSFCITITQTHLKKYLSVNYVKIQVISLEFEMHYAPEVLTEKPKPSIWSTNTHFPSTPDPQIYGSSLSFFPPPTSANFQIRDGETA